MHSARTGGSCNNPYCLLARAGIRILWDERELYIIVGFLRDGDLGEMSHVRWRNWRMMA